MPREHRLLFLVFLAAFLARLVYIFQVDSYPLSEFLISSGTFDQHWFDKAALFITNSNWFGLPGIFFKEPFYSYFLAVIYKFFGYSHMAVYTVQALLTSIGVFLIYKATAQVLNNKTAIIASFIFAFYSPSIFYDALLIRASLIAFLNMLLFFCIIMAKKEKRCIWWVFAGISSGLAMLTRHHILYIFILLYILFSERPLKKAFLISALFLAAMCTAISPVIIRNYISSGGKEITISSDNTAFWVGNAYDASGIDFDKGDSYMRLIRETGGDIKKIPRLFIRGVKKRPREYARLYLRKLWMFFNGYEFPSNTNYYLYRDEFNTLISWPLFNFRFISSLAIPGLFMALFRRRKPYILYLFFAILAMQVVLFHTPSRLRFPVTPFFAIFSSYTMFIIFERIRNRRVIDSILLIILAAALFLILKPDYSCGGFFKNATRIRAIDRTNLALAYLYEYNREGSPEDIDFAIRQCDLAIEGKRRDYLPYRIKGYISLMKKDYVEAEREYKEAIIYNNRDPFLYNEIAGVYFQEGDFRRSYIFVKRALRLFPSNRLFEGNLRRIPEEYRM